MRIVVSAGHGKYISGATGYITENEEAWRVTQRVVDILNDAGVEAIAFRDNTSHDQNTNLETIVDFHNDQTRDLDVSIHFNSNGTTSGPLGSEVWYMTSAGHDFASTVVDRLASVGFKNRGTKQTDDLYFLRHTEEPAILVETCFVTSKADTDLYQAEFEDVCLAIAHGLMREEDIEEGVDPEILRIAEESKIAEYSWRDRGVAPLGYTKGVALAWAQCIERWLENDPIVLEMAKANTHNDDLDAISWYNSNFVSLGMTNETSGLNTLRHLFVLLMGLGMRESSGRHCEGRDMSADNVSADTAEAGLYQTSYNAHVCCDEFSHVMNDYMEGVLNGYMSTFAEDVSCNQSSWDCYGSSSSMGYKFQRMCKEQPAFAVESCALVLRNLRQHYGPINRKEAEIREDADTMLFDVQQYMLGDQPEEEMPEVEITIRTKGKVKVIVNQE